MTVVSVRRAQNDSGLHIDHSLFVSRWPFLAYMWWIFACLRYGMLDPSHFDPQDNGPKALEAFITWLVAAWLWSTAPMAV
jgi:hypothetical protein